MDDKDFLSYFEELKQNKPEIIESSISKIIKSILAISHANKSENNQKDLEYTLNKLIEGLTLTSIQIQQNYSFAICQIFKRFKDQIKIKEYLDKVLEKTNKKYALNKQEVSHFVTGRMFFFLSLMKSQI